MLEREEWLPLAEAHALAVDELCAPTLARRQQGLHHPTEDFLWHYYSLRPSQLRRWHPGAGLALAAAPEYSGQRGYEVSEQQVARVSESFIKLRADSWRQILRLLRATANRPARYGCSALHEWAMVYGLEPREIRHEQVPLRLSPAEIRDVVDAAPLLCSHYDAFRFYTPQARPLNRWQLTRQTQADYEQGACLHANMDLYKWAYKLLPAIPSDLLMRCFALARQARELDMAASPYDNSAWGIEPVRVETPAGRAQFSERQQALAAAAAPLRAELIQRLERLLD